MLKPTIAPPKFSCKEDEVVKDLSLFYCASKSEKTKRTVFWLPATDQVVEQNERLVQNEGVPVVVRNGEFQLGFPEYLRESPMDD